ncbi:MAG: hypothetical protein ACI4B9_00595 [Eggerthellaceae bacterium]
MPEANENTTQGAPAEEKTFTQAQMDAIIGDRLARERENSSICVSKAFAN